MNYSKNGNSNGHGGYKLTAFMKSRQEIQYAHDLLQSCLSDVPEVMGALEEYEQSRIVINAYRDALCWILDHPNGAAFDKNVDRLEGVLIGLGYGRAEFDGDDDDDGPPSDYGDIVS